jgi:hypothetical protein
MRDYLRNHQFRKDVYVKGKAQLTKAERDRIFQDVAIVRLVPEGETPALIQTPIGPIELFEPPFGTLLAAIEADGNKKSVGELAEQCNMRWGKRFVQR